MDCSPWKSPGQNIGVGSLSLLQGIFPTQGLNSGLLHCRWILNQLSYQGSLKRYTKRNTQDLFSKDAFEEENEKSLVKYQSKRSSVQSQSVLKKRPACQCRRHETWVQSLGWEDPLEEGTATRSSILDWRIPWTEEPGGHQSMELQSQSWLKRASRHIATIWNTQKSRKKNACKE